ncbi:NPCBM/NEW2 domain-containing protein [Luteolibacter flavescens]|uniref:NPCBM/NEW2 domain-containing protein n=1 Tax=Luteolibacter flavescens TaxID=1859460 RepID=A0ABT3FUZ6_9BACT|nr:PVC-type heme-binding CxxCH protein [Luteolibacter flavescens]MCW1887029.1 NPCBM/NEW2 domain-containing protein [Luteolibacter flavescens]
MKTPMPGFARLLAAGLLMVAQAHAANKIVFLAGGKSHGPGEHEFRAGCMLLAEALNESGLDVQAEVHSGWPSDEKVLDGAKALIIYADGTSVVGKGWDKVDQMAKSGVGLMFMHYAVHPSKEEGDKYYRPWIGGAFEDDFSVNPHWVADLKVLPNHPVSRGVGSLVEAYDEFYYNMRFAAQTANIAELVTAVPDRERMKRYINLWNQHGVDGLGKKQTLMWGIERPDGGRGVGFTGGHYHRNWSVDGFRKIVLNAIVWTAGVEIPKDGVTSKPLTEDELNANLDEKGNAPRLTLVKPGEVKQIPAAQVDVKREAAFPQVGPQKFENGGRQPAARKGPPAKPVAETAAMNARTPRLEEIKARIEDAKELYLVVSDNGDMAYDWANWIEPKIYFKDGSSKDLTDLPWTSVTTGWGEAKVGKNVGGNALTIDKKTYEKGIGTHASSTIVYKLPENVRGFTAKVGIDDGGMFQNGEAKPANVKFAVYTEKPPEAGDSAETLVPEDLFSTPDDNLEVTVWATTPMLRNPTNIDFDAEGRMYVAEGVNYRHASNARPEGDRVVILSDTDGNGMADTTEVFTQDKNLESPLGIAVLENKVIVSQPPDLIVYTDVNGDRKFDPAVDKREVLLTGFNARQHDHSLHSVTVGPDGLWNFNNGNCGAIFTDKSGKTFRIGSGYYKDGGGTWYQDVRSIAGQPSDDGNVWVGGFSVRMNPDGTNARIVGHNYRNSYEQALTSFGDMFQSDNDDPPACRVTEVIEGGNAGFSSADGKRSWGADRRPGQDVPTAEWRQEDPGTMPAGDIYGGGSPTGVAFYENGALGDKWQGLLLACEAGKNVIYGYLPVPDGAGFKLQRIDFLTSNKEKQFSGSDFIGGPSGELKTLFRPADVAVGPDGALYVADWFDPRVGGHGTMDKSGSGTIYRIAPKGFKPVLPKIDLNTTEGQIAALKSPAVNVRNSGFVRLKEQGEKAVPAVADLLKDKNPYIAARAVWLLAQMGPSGEQVVTGLLSSEDARMRLVACRAVRAAGADVVKLAEKMAADPSPMVRREIALSLRDVPVGKSLPFLVTIGEKFDGKDRAYLEAFGLGCTGKEAAIYDALRSKVTASPEMWTDTFAWLAWRLHAPQAVADQKARALSGKVSAEQVKLTLTALGFTNSAAAAAAMIELANTASFSQKELAGWWVNNRKGNLWKAYDVDGILKAMGQDPANVKLTAVEMPAEPAGVPKLPPTAEILKLQGDAARGKTAVAACYMCHRLGDTGVDYGPDLTSFGKQQPAEVIIEAIVNPSADVSHGYDGTEIKTTDGLTIVGIALSDGDPVIMKSLGGQTQTIAKSRIASMKKMDKSLMYTPAMLGLSAQSVADITAYLKSL